MPIRRTTITASPRPERIGDGAAQPVPVIDLTRGARREPADRAVDPAQAAGAGQASKSSSTTSDTGTD